MTNLDKNDKKILLELDKNSRQSYTQIAGKVRLSKEAVRLRIQKLEKEKIIEGYYSLVNFPLLGENLYLIYLKTYGMNPEIEKKFIEHVNKIKNVGLNVSVIGFSNFNLAIWSKSPFEFEKTFTKILEGFEKYIFKKIIMVESSANYFKNKFFFPLVLNTDILRTESASKPEEIDNRDFLILESLAENARISASDLAVKTNLTAAAVAQRIKNLEKRKIILGYKVQVNFNLFHLKIFLKLQDMNGLLEKKMINYLNGIREVVSVSKTYGDYDLEFRIQVESILQIEEIINGFRTEFQKNFQDFEMIIFTRFHKVLNYFPA